MPAFAVTTELFYARRGVGLFAHAWAFLVTGVPRVHVGAHHPSDVLAGAVLGAVFMAVAAHVRVLGPAYAGDAARRFMASHRGRGYAGLFFLTHQVATPFSDTRRSAASAVRALYMMP